MVDENFILIYVYFEYKAQQTHNGLDIVSNLLGQVVSQLDIIPAELEIMFNKNLKKSTRPDEKQITRILLSCSQKVPVYAIFDAVDECHDVYQDNVLSLFADLLHSRYRLLISSRPHLTKLRETLVDTQTFNISAAKSDLRTFILARLKNQNKDAELELGCINLIDGVKGV
jgi:hypothetical protein